ncbi:hypothetical protein ACFC26_23940 [Kitasatospora purpeofusca]|uniref:hypothetical protein n=1 Tax=Kitasatospora purpeofusca TaxID=67352 RepID=UPI0035D55BF0
MTVMVVERAAMSRAPQPAAVDELVATWENEAPEAAASEACIALQQVDRVAEVACVGVEGYLFRRTGGVTGLLRRLWPVSVVPLRLAAGSRGGVRPARVAAAGGSPDTGGVLVGGKALRFSGRYRSEVCENSTDDGELHQLLPQHPASQLLETQVRVVVPGGGEKSRHRRMHAAPVVVYEDERGELAGALAACACEVVLELLLDVLRAHCLRAVAGVEPVAVQHQPI